MLCAKKIRTELSVAPPATGSGCDRWAPPNASSGRSPSSSALARGAADEPAPRCNIARQPERLGMPTNQRRSIRWWPAVRLQPRHRQALGRRRNPGAISRSTRIAASSCCCSRRKGFGFSMLKEDPTWGRVAGWFDHVPWEGLVFWDLIQPAFMFMVGVAMPFALAARKARGATRTRQLPPRHRAIPPTHHPQPDPDLASAPARSSCR